MSQQAWRKWGRGVLGAAINSAASAVTVVIVDPKVFDPANGGIWKLLSVMGVSAIFGAALYLKNHPLPDDETVSTKTIRPRGEVSRDSQV